MARNEARLELSAVDNATRVIQGVQASVQKLASHWQLLGSTFAVGIATSFLADSIRLRSALDDLGDTTGDTVQNLDGLRRVLAISGQGIDSVAPALARMGKNLAVADEEGKGAAAAVKALGLDLGRLQALKPAEGFFEIAKALGQFEDGAEKVAVATALFGKEGAKLLPVLKDLAEDGELAGRITADLAAQAEQLEKSYRRLALTLDDAKNALVSGMVPALSSWVQANVEAVRIAGSATEALRLFVFNIDAMTTERPRQEIERLTEALKRFQEASAVGRFIQSPTGVIFGGREEDLKKQIEFLRYLERSSALDGRTGEQFLDARDLAARQKPRLDVSGLGGSGKASKAGKDPFEEAARRGLELSRHVDASIGEAEAAILGRETYAQAVALGEFRAREAVAEEARIKRLAGLQADYANAEAAAVQARVRQYKELADPQLVYREQLEEIAELHRAGQLSVEQYAGAALAIYGKMDEETRRVTKSLSEQDELARSLSVTLVSGFSQAITQGKDLRGVLKGIGQDILQIVAKKTVLDPLEGAIEGIIKGGIGSLFGGFGGGLGGTVLGGVSGFAGGGRPPLGRISLVGERGPELFIPDRAGTIVPNNRLGGNNYTFYLESGVDMRVVEAIRAEMFALAGPGRVERRAIAAVSEARRR